MYKTPFLITEPVGNNAFSYDTRANKQISVPAMVVGTFRDLKIGNTVVFEEEDEYGVLRSCYGLENFVRMEWKGIPLVVFDNHNHALYFWYEAQHQGILGAQNTLVHIDEHSDLWENENDILETDLVSVHHFTNYRCNVGNYIQPALRQGIIEKVLRIEDSIGMGKYGSYMRGSGELLILNLDLDFFAKELDYIPFEDKKRVILHFASQAHLITVATSPFFIDQQRALDMFGRVFEL